MTNYQPIFDQGHNAYHDGVTTNPHPADTVEHGYWWEGWRVAEFFEKARRGTATTNDLLLEKKTNE